MYYFLWQLYHLQQDEASSLQHQQELKDKLEELQAQNDRCVHAVLKVILKDTVDRLRLQIAAVCVSCMCASLLTLGRSSS